jgi:hypothetical protein
MPYYMFCPRQKKIIFRTFKITGTLVFHVPERERERESKSKREKWKVKDKDKDKERVRKKNAGDKISKPPGPE